MKSIKFNSRSWDSQSESIQCHTISFKVSDETANSLMADLDFKKGFPFQTNEVDGRDYEIIIEDAESGEIEFHAERL